MMDFGWPWGVAAGGGGPPRAPPPDPPPPGVPRGREGMGSSDPTNDNGDDVEVGVDGDVDVDGESKSMSTVMKTMSTGSNPSHTPKGRRISPWVWPLGPPEPWAPMSPDVSACHLPSPPFHHPQYTGTPWRLLEAILWLAGKHLESIWEASGSHLGAPWKQSWG